MIGSSIVSATAAGQKTTQKSDYISNFDPQNFEEVYEFVVQYREADRSERVEMESNLTVEEREAATDALRPVKTTTYIRRPAEYELHSSPPVSTLSETVDENPQNKWGWNEQTIKDLVSNDSKQSLTQQHKSETGSIEVQSCYDYDAENCDDEGIERWEHEIEKSNLAGYNTVFRWQHRIEFDVYYTSCDSGLDCPPDENTDVGYRIQNARSTSRPIESSWWMDYKGIIDENEWETVDNYNGNNDNTYDEYYHSYKQVKFKQKYPLVDLVGYYGYPYSEIKGTGNTRDIVKSGIDG